VSFNSPSLDSNPERVLVAGWFSLQGHGATAGDLMARDLACQWLAVAGRPFDVANDRPFTGGVDWRAVDPAAYSDLLLVCGPFLPEVLAELRARFQACRLTGLNLSILSAADRGQFEFLLERESAEAANPDITYVAPRRRVPVVGVVPTREFQANGTGRVDEAHLAVRQLLDARDVAVVVIDTRIDSTRGLLRTPDQVESLIARTDVVVTTRLHGLVLALRAGVPALAIDPVVGGGKILPQARVVGWPYAYSVDCLDRHELDAAFEACLTPAARDLAAACRDRGRTMVDALRARFMSRFAPRVEESAGAGTAFIAESMAASDAALDLFPTALEEVLAWNDELRGGLAWWKGQADAWEEAARRSQEDVAEVRRGLEWWKGQAEAWDAAGIDPAEPLGGTTR
jgi:Polysaccharide pyruvyl transferase